jgi:phosphatidylglycerol:prolipoprotein diacylglycerol transferase
MPPISPTFNIGPLIFHWYGIIIVLGALAGAYVASLEAKRRGQDPEHVWNGLTWCLIAGIVGARLYHIFSTPQGTSIGFEYYFVTHPFEPVDIFGTSIPFPTALMIWNGGLGIFGAIAGGVLALVIYTRHYHLPFAMWLDIAAPGIPLGQAIGRWGNFVNQELYGPPTDLPWGIPIDANHRIPPYTDLSRYPLDTTRFHPVFLYESLWNLAAFIALMVVARRYQARLKDGDIISLYLILYGIGRIFVESLRPDAWLVGGIPAAQLVSAAAIVLGVGLIAWRRQGSPEPEVEEAGEQVPGGEQAPEEAKEPGK